MTMEALTSLLRAEPPDRDSWAVYADLLLEQEDPFGELVSSALQGTSSVGLLRAARERRDSAYWPEALLSWSYTPELTWRMGLWDELELVVDSLESAEDSTVAALQEICAHPAARLLRCLRLRFDSQMDWDHHLYHLSALTPLAVPLSLDLEGARYVEQDALPHIRGLEALHAWSIQLTEPLERLRSLVVEGSLDAATARQLSRMPALRELSMGCSDGLPPVDWGALPLLSHLGLTHLPSNTRDIFERLAPQTELRSLEIGTSELLSRLPQAWAERLQVLTLSWASRETLRELRRCPALQELHLTACELPKPPASVRALHLNLSSELPDLRGVSLERLSIRQNPVARGTFSYLKPMRELRELALESPYDDGLIGDLGALAAVPGLQVLDLRRYHGAPEELRWRFEGEELRELLRARAPARRGGAR
jgi:uncharacterized protein (TIGR02996 family)